MLLLNPTKELQVKILVMETDTDLNWNRCWCESQRDREQSQLPVHFLLNSALEAAALAGLCQAMAVLMSLNCPDQNNLGPVGLGLLPVLCHRNTWTRPISCCPALWTVSPGRTLELLWVPGLQAHLWSTLQQESGICAWPGPSPFSGPALCCFWLVCLDLALSGPCERCPSPSWVLFHPVGLCPLFGEAALAWCIFAIGESHLLALQTGRE